MCRTIEIYRIAGFFFDFFLRCGVYALSKQISSVVIQEGARVDLTGLLSAATYEIDLPPERFLV